MKPFILLLITALVGPLTWAACPPAVSKSILFENDSGYSAEWTFKNSAELRLRADLSEPAYLDYAAWVKEHTPLTAIGLLQNHLNILIRANLPTLANNIQKVQDIISGKIGDIHPLTCLESVPLLEFLKVVDLREHSMEFIASVYTHAEDSKIIGDFYFTGDATSVGAAESQIALEKREELHRSGWVFESIYHNHPFVFRDGFTDIGGNLAPSEADLNYFLRIAPQTAIISNGIDSLVLQNDEFLKLKN